MRRLLLAFFLALCSVPAFAADMLEPVAIPASERASDADIDRLLEVMDLKSMMEGMMKQMGDAQSAMVAEAFGQELSDADRVRMQDILAKTNAITRKHLSWQALEPIMRRIYAQVFSKREVDAMVAFYSTPEGTSMLKKMPQAMALSMQEMQPIARDTMSEVRAMIDGKASAAKSGRPRE